MSITDADPMPNVDELRQSLIEATKNGDLSTFRSIFNENGNIKVNDFRVDFRVEDFLDRFQLERDSLFHIQTLLHLAAYALQPDIASFLLKEMGATINSRDQGKTPLHVAVSSPLAFIESRVSTESPVSVSSSSKLAMVKFLVESGADINAVDNDGQNALHLVLASISGCYDEMEELVRYLLDHGCSLSQKDREGYSPFHLACSDAPVRIARLLLDYGACPTMPDADGWAPIQMAACNPNCTQVLELLLSAGATVHVQSSDKNTPAHFAKTVQHAKILFEMGGADLTIQNKYGETPAQMATGRKRLEVAEYLQLAQEYSTRRKQCKQILFVKDQHSTTEKIENEGADEIDEKNHGNIISANYEFAVGMLSPVVNASVNGGRNADLVAGYACLREAISRLA